MKAKLAMTMLLALLAMTAQGQSPARQLKIPIGADGIDCAPDGQYGEYWIYGFDTDQSGNLLIVAANAANEKTIYTVDESGNITSKSSIANDCLWMFPTSGAPAIITHTMDDGYVIKRQGQTFQLKPKSLPSMLYVPDEGVAYFTGPLYVNTSGGLRTLPCHVSFSLKDWCLLTDRATPFRLPKAVAGFLEEDRHMEYKGMKDGNYMFCKAVYDDPVIEYEVLTVDSAGNLLFSFPVKKADLPPDPVCTFFGCNIETERLLRNGMLYFLGADKTKKLLEVTVIPACATF